MTRFVCGLIATEQERSMTGLTVFVNLKAGSCDPAYDI